jgi:ion channel
MYQIPMLTPLLLGLAVTFFTILVHALTLRAVVAGVRRYVLGGPIGIWVWDVTLVMTTTLLVLAGHLVEMALWALSFILCGQFSNFPAAFYYSAVCYTTLGDSSIALSPRWRLLVPIEAADGMLMFGISTAIIFAVMHRLVMARFARERDPQLKAI